MKDQAGISTQGSVPIVPGTPEPDEGPQARASAQVGDEADARLGEPEQAVLVGDKSEAITKLIETDEEGTVAVRGAVVDLLYTNIANAPPDAATRDYFIGLLDDQTYTIVGLAMAAANSSSEIQRCEAGTVGRVSTAVYTV